MTRVLPNCGMEIYLHYTEEFIASGWEKHTDAFESFSDQCFMLRGVKQVCTDHQVWISVEPKSRTWESIAAEIRLIDKKVRAIIARGR